MLTMKFLIRVERERGTSANSETETEADLIAFSICFSFTLFNGAFHAQKKG